MNFRDIRNLIAILFGSLSCDELDHIGNEQQQRRMEERLNKIVRLREQEDRR